jgi:hypothetical protein
MKLVEYLVAEASFSKHRIAFESPVSMPRDKSTSRTDLICYSDDFKPLLLVECKAPEIQLDEKVALQIGRYNTQVEAPFLLVTNGLYDYWFEVNNNDLIQLSNIPNLFASNNAMNRDFEYWSKRGFLGKHAPPTIHNWLIHNCQSLFVEPSNPARFFSFDGTEPELVLPNFYQVLMPDEQMRLAISFSATPFGATKMNAILNRGGQNIGLLSASVELIASGEAKNTLIQTAEGIRQVDLKEELDFSFDEPLTEIASSLAGLMN